MNFVEHAISFSCHGMRLYGILSLPENALSRAVLIVVGGPQYRAGSNRQFTLIARELAAQGVPVMRFDYRGMGDSEGDMRLFDSVNDDIQAAVNYLFLSVPVTTEIVIFGLCDAASAALFYAYQDKRISGLVLINPWIRTEEGIAKAYIKHYYFSRMLEADLWKKILRGQFNYRMAFRSFYTLLSTVYFEKIGKQKSKEKGDTSSTLPVKMLDCFSKYKGRVLLILSGNDLTAKEFLSHVGNSKVWKEQLKSERISNFELPGADHTFSRRVWRDQVTVKINTWIQSW